MPIDINLLLTTFMWVFALLIFLSSRKSNINRWCAIGIALFSLGGFKEYYFFALAPALGWEGAAVAGFYSVMTAVLYDLAMPAVLIFVLYFCGLDKVHPRAFLFARWLMLVPILLLVLFFPPTQTREFQLGSRLFWYVMSVYNLAYGITATFIMLRTLMREKSLILRRQKRWVSIISIPPIWYWLLTIFVIHSLQLKELFKLWQGNLIIIVLLLLFYIAMAFREGMMGLKLNSENYQWNSDQKMVYRGAQYTGHMLKNEMAKIKWSVRNLRRKLAPTVPEEVDIIDRSADHVQEFVEKTKQYSGDLTLQPSLVDVHALAGRCLAELIPVYPGVAFSVECPEGAQLWCDPTHTEEVVGNLLANAVESLPECRGSVAISFIPRARWHYASLTVVDNGSGMTREQKENAFAPYQTTKEGSSHFGLGLFYCYQVMSRHNGYIKIDTEPGKGCRITLFFPGRPRKRKE